MSRWEDAAVPRGDAYDARWRRLAAAGENVHGEADFVESLSPTTVLDAGCGTGRVAIELARRGITTVGVDLDRAMLATARRNGPETVWIEGDLTSLAIEEPGALDHFDVVVAAGNVMIFLRPGTETAAVARMAAHLRPGGALVAGFQLSSPYGLERYDADCAAAGLTSVDRFATWDREPWEGGDYAVSVHRAPS